MGDSQATEQEPVIQPNKLYLSRRQFIAAAGATAAAAALSACGVAPPPSTDIKPSIPPALAGSVVLNEPLNIGDKFVARFPFQSKGALNSGFNAPRVLPGDLLQVRGLHAIEYPAATSRFYNTILSEIGLRQLNEIGTTKISVPFLEVQGPKGRMYIPQAVTGRNAAIPVDSIVSHVSDFGRISGSVAATIQADNVTGRIMNSNGSLEQGTIPLSRGQVVQALAELNQKFIVLDVQGRLVVVPANSLPKQLLIDNHTLLRMGTDVAAKVVEPGYPKDMLALRDRMITNPTGLRMELKGTSTGDYMIFHSNGRDFLLISRPGFRHMIDIAAYESAWVGAGGNDGVSYVRHTLQRAASADALVGKYQEVTFVGKSSGAPARVPLSEIVTQKLSGFRDILGTIGVVRQDFSMLRGITIKSTTMPMLSTWMLNYILMRESVVMAANCLNCGLDEKLMIALTGRPGLERIDLSTQGKFVMNLLPMPQVPDQPTQLYLNATLPIPLFVSKVVGTNDVMVMPLASIGYKVGDNSGHSMPEDPDIFALQTGDEHMYSFPTPGNGSLTTELTMKNDGRGVQISIANRAVASAK